MCNRKGFWLALSLWGSSLAGAGDVSSTLPAAPGAPGPPLSPPALDLRRVYSIPNGAVAPISGFAGRTGFTINSNGAAFVYQGAEGTLRCEWTPPRAAGDPPLGWWQLSATARGQKDLVVVPFARDARLDWLQPAVFKGSRLEKAADGVTCFSTYEVNGRPAILQIHAALKGKSIVMELDCGRPIIASLSAGGWGSAMHRRQIAVPYFTGQVFYLADQNLFVTAFLDWTQSSASVHLGTRADYHARTDGTRNPVHERAIFSAAWHEEEVLPNIPNPPSPFREHLAGRIVLDVCDGQFDDIASNLTVLHDYGLNQCAVIIHNWQRSGFDNALPAHVPANARFGGDAGMKHLVSVAENLGFDIALHENYVDYYPNYEGFNPADVALDSNGNRERAWLNPGTKIQSFAVQPHAILRLARDQGLQIRERYHPNTAFLDVHSAVPPWFHVDDRAGAVDAAMFRPVFQAHRQLWAFERKNHDGPVFGEGGSHWFWSGLLDGVEAQFGAGWPGNAGPSAPLMVDFDLLKIHPLQFNHGMGYYERWWASPSWGSVPPMEILDQYRMQEVIYGHAGYLGCAISDNLPLAWLEYHLLSPVAQRYAAALPVQIDYQVDGRWVDGTAAAKAGVWNRVRVTYDNGLTVIANQETNLLRAANVDLPRFGWLAQGAGLTAWTAQLHGVIADYAATANGTFANARPAADWYQSGIHNIHPAVAGFRQTADREFILTYEWQVGESLPRDYQCFVHFVQNEQTLFQDDHALPRPTSSWNVGEVLQDGPRQVRLPKNLPDGDYDIRLGLYRLDSGRLLLLGQSDGHGRFRVGTLHVGDRGRKLRFDPNATPVDFDKQIYWQHLNVSNQVLDFGDVRTDGSVALRRDGNGWILQPYPRTRNFFVELKAARFGNPSKILCVAGDAPAVEPRVRDGWWQLPLNGAKAYRW